MRTSGNSARLSAADSQRLYLAEQVLIRRCMNGLGFRYWIVPFGDLPTMTPRAALAIPSLAAAKVHGFHPPSASPPFNQAPANAYYAKLSPRRRAAWTAAITGDPGGARRIPAVQVRLPQGLVMGHSRLGCVASAEKRLYGDYQAWFAAENTVQALREIAVQEVPHASTYVSATRRWSRCMSARGYTAASPPKFRSAVTRPMRAHPTVREIAAATASAGCAESTGLTRLALRLQRHYWNGLSRHYRKEVSTYRKLALIALPAAEAILAVRHA
ncbi:MAG TPA: hypothetical protein VFI65_02635 [Streptosporangiaceae bacterium]|nr:hypothetical protein [Streptosporangiaceae bacterium]